MFIKLTYAMRAAVVKSAAYLEGSIAAWTLPCFMDAWALVTSIPSAVAIAYMVVQKTVHRVDHPKPYISDGGQTLTSLAGQPLLCKRSREGLVNEPTSASPQVRYRNYTNEIAVSRTHDNQQQCANNVNFAPFSELRLTIQHDGCNRWHRRNTWLLGIVGLP